MADYNQLLQGLHPSVRDVARMFLEEAVAAGLDPRVQETFRSRERQAELYAKGRTAPGAIVTKAAPGQSNHNYGVAFDVVPGALLSKPNWAPEDPAWASLGEIGKKYGLEWGGDWKFVDKPHFQLSGANWRTLQNDPAYAKFSGSGSPVASPGASQSPTMASAGPAPPGQMPVQVTMPQQMPAQGAAPQQMAFGDVVGPQEPMSFGNVLDSFNRRRRQADEEEQARQSRLAALFASMPA